MLSKIMKKRLAILVLIFGCLLVIAAFIVNPTGEIHYSVMVIFSLCLGFSAGMVGVEFKVDLEKIKLLSEGKDVTGLDTE